MKVIPYVLLTTDLTEQVEEAKLKLTYWDELLKNLGDKAVSFGLSILAAVIAAFIGKKLINFIIRLLKKSFERTSVDEGVSKFLISMIRVLLYVVLIMTVISILGIQTTSFAAIIGSAGVTIGLAFQGSLSNFAGGVLILLLKPFKVGDYIIAEGNEGTVTGIDIFYTRLQTVDNRFVVIPNGKISNCNLTNVTSEEERRLDLFVDIDYSENVKRVRDILLQVLNRNEMILKGEHPIDIFVDNFEASSIRMGIRVWVETDNYWKLKWHLLEEIKETFDHNHVVIPYNQLDVNLKK